MALVIRDATTKDIAAIQQLATAAYISEQGEARAGSLLKRVYAEDTLRRAIENEGTAMLLALDADGCIGYCRYGSPLLDDCEDTKSIHVLLVHPDYDVQMVGEALLAEVEATLDEEACTQRLISYVPATDKTKLHFYLKAGFVHEMVEDTPHEWYMEKEL